MPDIRSGIGPYLIRLSEIAASAERPAVSLLRQVVVDVAAELYRCQADSPVELLEFSDGAFDVLFDAAQERTVLMLRNGRELRAENDTSLPILICEECTWHGAGTPCELA